MDDLAEESYGLEAFHGTTTAKEVLFNMKY